MASNYTPGAAFNFWGQPQTSAPVGSARASQNEAYGREPNYQDVDRMDNEMSPFLDYISGSSPLSYGAQAVQPAISNINVVHQSDRFQPSDADYARAARGVQEGVAGRSLVQGGTDRDNGEWSRSQQPFLYDLLGLNHHATINDLPVINNRGNSLTRSTQPMNLMPARSAQPVMPARAGQATMPLPRSNPLTARAGLTAHPILSNLQRMAQVLQQRMAAVRAATGGRLGAVNSTPGVAHGFQNTGPGGTPSYGGSFTGYTGDPTALQGTGYNVGAGPTPYDGLPSAEYGFSTQGRV